MEPNHTGVVAVRTRMPRVTGEINERGEVLVVMPPLTHGENTRFMTYDFHPSEARKYDGKRPALYAKLQLFDDGTYTNSGISVIGVTLTGNHGFFIRFATAASNRPVAIPIKEAVDIWNRYVLAYTERLAQ